MTALASSLSTRLAGIAALLIGLAGCATHPAPLGPRPVASEITTRGEPVYVGTVFPLQGGSKDPAFVYERRVDERDGEVVSTHVTRDATGEIAIAESAAHSPDYALREYTLHTNQLGQSGTVRVEKDRIVFHLIDGGRERTEVEPRTGPVAVGPTLVGYIREHLPALRAGEKVGVRLAILDRLETLGFDLRAFEGGSGQTRVKMEPSSFVVGLVVDPILFTFETAGGKLVRLEGRVPPKVRDHGDWEDFDARVEYRYVAAAYR